MDKHSSNKSNHNNDTMLKEKTNQDYNKQKPDPKDPNQKKNHQAGEDEEREFKERSVRSASEGASKEGQQRQDGNKDIDDNEYTDRPPNRERNQHGKQSENKFEKYASKKRRV